MWSFYVTNFLFNIFGLFINNFFTFLFLSFLSLFPSETHSCLFSLHIVFLEFLIFLYLCGHFSEYPSWFVRILFPPLLRINSYVFWYLGFVYSVGIFYYYNDLVYILILESAVYDPQSIHISPSHFISTPGGPSSWALDVVKHIYLLSSAVSKPLLIDLFSTCWLTFSIMGYGDLTLRVDSRRIALMYLLFSFFATLITL